MKEIAQYGSIDSTKSHAIGMPTIIAASGDDTCRQFIEFFAVNIRNPNTRKAYYRAVVNFLNWCGARGIKFEQIGPLVVAAYIEQHTASTPTVKQHLAAIRMLFDWLVVGHVIPVNPALSVRGPKYVLRRGKTPILAKDETRMLLEKIDISSVMGLRDRALIATMVYSFARVGAVVGMRVGDYYKNGKRWWLRLHEKGGKFHEVPAHHKLEEYIDTYINISGLWEDAKGPLFRTVLGKSRKLTNNYMAPADVYRMIRRRAKQVGITTPIGCHTFRAIGITSYLENGGTLERAQILAAHSSPRTTKLYDRTGDKITLDEVERIVI
ncbi:MAG: tyrosine-type recombinase/integrase [Thermodesulfobacteriota bacterium]